jgi:hypothetical protein
MDAQLANPLPDGFHITSMTKAKAIQAGRYQPPCPLILKLHSPFPECLCLLYLDHI